MKTKKDINFTKAMLMELQIPEKGEREASQRENIRGSL
jgi:hypothetical protein